MIFQCVTVLKGCDFRLYSFMLGRPHMVRKETCDVHLPDPMEPDGTRNTFNISQNVFINLADLLGEVSDKVVISIHVRNLC